MPGITLEQAQAQLDAWLAASAAVAQGQSYSITTESGSRSLDLFRNLLCHFKIVNASD